VACIEEAIELRYAGVTAPILLLEGVFEQTELATAAKLDMWLTISNEQQLGWLEDTTLPLPVRCWLKVDTGMNRLGVTPAVAPLYFKRLKACKNVLEDIVTYTHFTEADDLQSAKTLQQLAIFAGLPFVTARSAANSAGLLAWPQAHYDWVRPGYMLYGNSPMLQDHSSAHALEPVMTLTSAVIALRDVTVGECVGYGGSWVAKRPSRIATVAMGYGDGYPRQAINGTPVLVNGQRAPLAGRVSMDMLTVDVTDLDSVQQGDEVVLWGPGLRLAEVAHCAGTIGYELTTRMPARTPRIIIDGRN
jgi:alanine racemase